MQIFLHLQLEQVNINSAIHNLAIRDESIEYYVFNTELIYPFICLLKTDKFANLSCSWQQIRIHDNRETFTIAMWFKDSLFILIKFKRTCR